MAGTTQSYQRLIVGVSSILLIVSVFLPWARAEDVHRTGWQFNTPAAVFFLVAGAFGLATALTGGRYGVTRADVSVIGATDMFNTVAMLLLAGMTIDFPAHTSRELGIFGALIGAGTTAFTTADYGPLRGKPWFPFLGSRN